MTDAWQYLPFHISATTSAPVAIGDNVATTAPTTIVAGSGVVVTPASMANIRSGRWLNFNGGTGTAEDVQVLSITATTFTANFANGHSGAYVISSQRTVDIGALVINNAGTGVTITLYNGHPNAWVAGTVFAVVIPGAGEPTREYMSICTRGLFYTLSGTPGDFTVSYHNRSGAS